MPDPVVLRAPTIADQEEVLAAHRATSPTWPSFLHFYEDGLPFRRYLEILEDVRHGRNPATADLVPETLLFGFVGDRIVGRCTIRHALTPWLVLGGGHIGYVVVPEFRRRGYATEILRLSLGVARDAIGLRRALVTCDDTNQGSIRTIEKNGGVLENVVRLPGVSVPKRRYWIDLSGPPGRAGLTGPVAPGGRS